MDTSFRFVRFSTQLLAATAFASLAATASLSACTTNEVRVVAADDAGADAGDDASSLEDAGGGETTCTSAREQLLLPNAKVSTGEVLVVSENAGVKTIYVDASAGGQGNSAKNPRVYVDLSAGARVDVSDVDALSSSAWDLAIKRTVLFTNGGHGGPGAGSALVLASPFAGVTAADVDEASLVTETFFDEECNPLLDPIGAPATTFSDWYSYDEQTNIPTPRAITYIVKGGTGKLFKVAIRAYDALPDGGSRENASTGFFLLDVAEL